MLQRLSIRLRLVILSITLVGMTLGTSFYLGNELDRASAAAVQADRLGKLKNVASDVRNSYGDLRYWMTDLAVSLLVLSETNADAARLSLKGRLDVLQTYEPGVAAAIRSETALFDQAAKNAVDAYTADQRVIGNSLVADARQHGLRVDALLTDLDVQLDARAHEARNLVLTSAATANTVSLGVVAATILLGVLLTVLVLQSILSPLRRLVSAVEAVSRGDNDVPLPAASGDEMGAMSHALALFRTSQQERLRLAAEEEKQRRTLADAIASIQEGFALFDADDRLVLNNATYMALHANAGNVATPGHTFEQVLRAAEREGLVQPAVGDVDGWLAMRRSSKNSSRSAVEARFGERWVRVTERPTHDGGAVALYADITDIKRREFDLERARTEAEQATKVKSEFLANMSHELRTPLNAIIGYSQILQEDAAIGGDRTTVSDLKKIESAGDHLLGLINDILDLSKVEAGKMEVYIELIDLPALAEEVRLLVEPLAAKNGNVVSIACDPELPSMRCDVTKVKQCLLNLMGNACKFTKGGQVRLDIRPDRARSGMVAFVITDTGIGITEVQQARLFRAFSQGDNSTTRQYGGTGLGLGITQSFAQMLGGSVSVTSVYGQGSVFTLLLPSDPAAIAEAAEVRDALPAHRDVRGPWATILVIDRGDRFGVIDAHLSHETYRVIHATAGPDVLSLARRESPDAIILDIMESDTNGWTILRDLKADQELADIPVVLVSTIVSSGVGVAVGAAAVLNKPVDRAALASALQTFALSHAKASVLIVEDDPAIRQLAERTVERLGLTAVLAGNGCEALEWLADHPAPSLILLDLLMPVMDGFEFLFRLRAKKDWTDIPVLVLTAKTLTNDERKELAGMSPRVIAKSDSGHRSLSRVLRESMAASERDA